jgi:acetylornithine deacetylase
LNAPASIDLNLPSLGRDAVASTLAALVRIESVNPAFGGPDGGEARVMDWVARFLADRGIDSERWDAYPGRPDLRAVIPGADRSRAILFETHIDTVSIAGMTVAPLGANIEGGRLWGRGSTDAKGQAAAMLHAFVALNERPEAPPCSIELVLAVDEESGFGGVKSLVERYQAEGRAPDFAVVGEPTELAVVVAHKGVQRWWMEIEGRAAHSARPALGVNAIRRAGWLVEAIEGDYAARLAGRSHPLLDAPTINVSIVQGGTQANMVPERARILLDRRTLPDETRASVEREFEEIVAPLRARHPDFVARSEPPFRVEPAFESDPASPIARAALSISARFGRSAAPIGVDYATDASRLGEFGVPTIVVGPGTIDVAHTAAEFIELDELRAGALYYHELMMSGLNGR